MSTMFPPFRIKKILKLINDSNIMILDIGSGNHSASITKKWIPNCNYTGVDKERSYNNDALDNRMMDNFFEIDLTKLNFEIIPDCYFVL